MIRTENVKKFLGERGYLWDGKVMNPDCSFTDVTEVSSFDGDRIIVNLITLEGKKLYAMKICNYSFEIYDICESDDPYRRSDEYVIKEYLKFEWLEFVIDNRIVDSQGLIKYCEQMIDNIKIEYTGKINKLKEKIKALETEMVKKSEPYSAIAYKTERSNGWPAKSRRIKL